MLRTTFGYRALFLAAIGVCFSWAWDCGSSCADCGCGSNAAISPYRGTYGTYAAYGTSGTYGTTPSNSYPYGGYSAYPSATGTYATGGSYGSTYGGSSYGNNSCGNGCGGCRRHRCSSCCCDPCGEYSMGSATGCGCGTTILPILPTPVAPPVAPGAKPSTTPPAPAPKSTLFNRPDAGLITLWIDPAAKVFINGRETTSTGTLRQYMVYGLRPGYTHTNEVRIVLVRDGHTSEQVRTVNLAAGQQAGLAVSFAPTANPKLLLAKRQNEKP